MSIPTPNTAGKALLLGYGNPGRLDDGLGPALAAKLEHDPIDGLDVSSDYQLVVEHSHEIAAYGTVIFADASLAGDFSYSFKEIFPAETPRVESHNVSPETLLFMAHKMFGARTRGYMLAIRGYEFNGFGERLSEGALENLAETYEFLRTRPFSGGGPVSPRPLSVPAPGPS